MLAPYAAMAVAILCFVLVLGALWGVWGLGHFRRNRTKCIHSPGQAPASLSRDDFGKNLTDDDHRAVGEEDGEQHEDPWLKRR